jgi:ferredoxin-NADP reductase
MCRQFTGGQGVNPVVSFARVGSYAEARCHVLLSQAEQSRAEQSRAEQRVSLVVQLQARSRVHVQTGRQTDKQRSAEPQTLNRDPVQLGAARVPMLVGIATTTSAGT